MNEPQKPIDNRVLVDAVNELKAMGSEGFTHPSTQPVLAAAAAGAVAGWILPFVGPIFGLIVGAAIMLYKRVRP